MGEKAKGVKKHLYYKGGAKTVCTSAVLAAFGIDSCSYHYSGQLKQRLQILNKNGWAARSRNSHVRRGYRNLKLKGIPKTQTRSVGQVRRIIALVNRDEPETNAWGDPYGTRYMIRVDGHALLLGYDGATLVDTDPRARDRRKVLDIRAVFPMPSDDEELRENPSYLRNPTPFVTFIQAERNLTEFVETRGAVRLESAIDRMPTYQSIDAASFAKFVSEEMPSVRNHPGFSALDEELRWLREEGEVSLNSYPYLFGVRAQKLFQELAHYFMLQHPINRKLLVERYEEFIGFLEHTLDSIYASPSRQFMLYNDILIHIERVFVSLRRLDPYGWNMITLDRVLSGVDNTVGIASASPFANPLLSSMAMLSALSSDQEGIAALVMEYIRLTDRLCDVLNPFPDKRIYCLRDITGFRSITCTSTTTGSAITF